MAVANTLAYHDTATITAIKTGDLANYLKINLSMPVGNLCSG
jgi:hypothetical protein